MGNQYLNTIIGTKAQRKANYYERKAANRAAREKGSFSAEFTRFVLESMDENLVWEAHNNTDGKPAKATYYKGQVIVRSGANGQGKEVVRGMVNDLATAASVCSEVIAKGYYIVNKDWMSKVFWRDPVAAEKWMEKLV